MMKTHVVFGFLRPLSMALGIAILLAGPISAQETASTGQRQAIYRIGADGLSCPFCAYGIEKELTAIDGVATVETDLRSGTIIVTMSQGSELARPRAKEAVEAAGFVLRSFDREG